jgi:hypothetical protein
VKIVITNQLALKALHLLTKAARLRGDVNAFKIYTAQFERWVMNDDYPLWSKGQSK